MSPHIIRYRQFQDIAISRRGTRRKIFTGCLSQHMRAPIFQVIAVSPPIHYSQTTPASGSPLGIANVCLLRPLSFSNGDYWRGFVLFVDNVIIILAIIALISDHSVGLSFGAL